MEFEEFYSDKTYLSIIHPYQRTVAFKSPSLGIEDLVCFFTPKLLVDSSIAEMLLFTLASISSIIVSESRRFFFGGASLLRLVNAISDDGGVSSFASGIAININRYIVYIFV